MPFIIKLLIILFAGLIWLGIVTYLRRKKKKSVVYLIFWTIFFIYMVKVLDCTIFEFQFLLLLKYFVPNLILKGLSTDQNTNLIPLVTLTIVDLKTSLLNILLFVPFGFGLPFITNFHLRQILGAAALVSISIELIQFLTGLLAEMTFRLADINDVIFNTVGALTGYLFFLGFLNLCFLISQNREAPTNPIIRYIAELPQLNK